MCIRSSIRSGLRGLVLAVLILAVFGLTWPAVGSTAHAQDPGASVETITLDEAVRLALQQNTEVQRAQGQARLGRVRVQQQRADFLPDLQLSSSGTRTFGRSFSQEEGGIINETSDFVGVDAVSSVNLFSGFEKLASLREARQAAAASSLRLERTREDVLFLVLDGYTTYLQNQQLAGVRQQELEVQQDLLDEINGLVEVGRRPRSDLFQQQALQAEARVAQVEAEREAELAATRLIQILQLDPAGRYAFEAPGLVDTTGLAEGALRTYDLDRLLETAFAQRSDLSAFQAEADAAQQGIRAARSGYWPSLSVSAAYGSDWSSNALIPIPGTGTDPQTVTVRPSDGGAPVTFPVPGTGSSPDAARPEFFDLLDQRRGGSVRLTLSVPLFDRLQTRTSVEEAQVQYLNTQYDLQDQRQQVALQVRQAVLDYRSARTRLVASEERLQAAARAREAARRRYELGAATFVELAQATSGYVAARSALVRARYDVLLTETLIDYYSGALDPAAARAVGQP